MYVLNLNGKTCISCGICMDVCPRKAIGMKKFNGKAVEGEFLIYLRFHKKGNHEHPKEEMMTFPYMQNPAECDGCMICVEECPTGSIGIVFENERAKISQNF